LQQSYRGPEASSAKASHPELDRLIADAKKVGGGVEIA